MPPNRDRTPRRPAPRAIGRVALAILYAIAATVCGAIAQPAPAGDLRDLNAALADDTLPQTRRDEAARRLASRATPDARAALLAGLVDLSNRGRQLAIARALATDPTPDPALIPPLNALLGTDRLLTDAAAAALANYKGSAPVLNLLTTFATTASRPEASRAAVLHALGTLPERRAAETLVALTAAGGEPPVIRAAAADALADMTGLRANARDPQRWADWWETVRAKPDADFRLDILAGRAARFDNLLARQAALTDEVTTLLYATYQDAPDPQKADRLLRLLRSAQPAIRMAGARVILTEALEARPVPPPARDQLRQMVGDSAPEVRLEVARALRAVNDAAAIDPILAQLTLEAEPDVRAALASALGPMQDRRAVAPLTALLRDPAVTVAESAAESLAALGASLRAADPLLASATAAELRRVLADRAAAPDATALRGACVEALVPLKSRDALVLLQALLRPTETARVRRAALRALGELAEPDSAGSVISALDEARTDAGIRLEAVNALGALPTFEHAETLYRRLDPAVEPDASVQTRAWTTLASLFPRASREQLQLWCERLRDQPERRLPALAALSDKLAAAGEDAADDLAVARQQIGETLLRLDRPADAAPVLRSALDHWRSVHKSNMYSEALYEQTLDALLRARLYPDAAAFAARCIADAPANQQSVGPRLRREAERLRDARDYPGAVGLLAEIRRMSPPLAARYLDDLRSVELDVRKALGEPTTTAPATAPTTRDSPG